MQNQGGMGGGYPPQQPGMMPQGGMTQQGMYYQGGQPMQPQMQRPGMPMQYPAGAGMPMQPGGGPMMGGPGPMYPAGPGGGPSGSVPARGYPPGYGGPQPGPFPIGAPGMPMNQPGAPGFGPSPGQYMGGQPGMSMSGPMQTSQTGPQYPPSQMNMSMQSQQPQQPGGIPSVHTSMSSGGIGSGRSGVHPSQMNMGGGGTQGIQTQPQQTASMPHVPSSSTSSSHPAQPSHSHQQQQPIPTAQTQQQPGPAQSSSTQQKEQAEQPKVRPLNPAPYSATVLDNLKDYNVSQLCLIGRELVHDLSLRTSLLCQSMKALSEKKISNPPGGDPELVMEYCTLLLNKLCEIRLRIDKLSPNIKLDPDEFTQRMTVPPDTNTEISEALKREQDIFDHNRHRLINVSSDLKMLDWMSAVSDPHYLKRVDKMAQGSL